MVQLSQNLTFIDDIKFCLQTVSHCYLESNLHSQQPVFVNVIEAAVANFVILVQIRFVKVFHIYYLLLIWYSTISEVLLCHFYEKPSYFYDFTAHKSTHFFSNFAKLMQVIFQQIRFILVHMYNLQIINGNENSRIGANIQQFFNLFHCLWQFHASFFKGQYLNRLGFQIIHINYILLPF